MNRLLLMLTLVLAAPFPAAAQNAPIEVKGVSLGADLDQLLAILGPRQNCIRGNGSEDVYDSLCGNSDPTGTLPDTFAGYPASISYSILGERVGEITVAHLRADNYPEVLDALTAKYGPPKIAHPPVQTRGGATFENTVATWTRGKDEIVYDRYGRTMEYSWLRFTSGSYADARLRWQAGRATEAAKDM